MLNKIISILEKYFGFAWAEYHIGPKLPREDFFEPSSAHLKVACQLKTLLTSRLGATEVVVTWVNNTSFNLKIDGDTYGVRTVVFKQ
jgi:hypothetical protein